MDALHVACALEWKVDLFITSAKKQFEAAIPVQKLSQQCCSQKSRHTIDSPVLLLHNHK
jgi:hypothetical protein